MKTKMNPYKKLVGSVVIGLHICGIALADSGPQGNIDDAKERTLLISLISLEGQNLPKEAYQAKALEAVGAYEKNSTDEQRSERFTQAVIDLQIMDPAQAESVKVSIDAQVNGALQANPEMNAGQRQQLVVNSTAEVLNHTFTGAQFSGCMASYIGASAILATAILGDVYASTLTHSSTSSQSTLGVTGGSSTTTSTGSSSSTTTVSTSGSASTTSSTVTPNLTEKKFLLTGSYILYGVAGAMYIYNLVNANSGGSGGICQ